MKPVFSQSAIDCLALAGCTTLAESPRPSLREAITISAGPCFGFCPVYDVTVAPDGRVSFSGRRHTAVIGERERRGSAGSYSTLARDLAKFRPDPGMEATADCIAVDSDTSPLTVAWVDPSGLRTTVTVRSGCSGGSGYKLVQVLRSVPSRLGVAEWSRQTTRPGATRG